MMPEVPASASAALGPRARLNENVVTAKAAPQGAGDVWTWVIVSIVLERSARGLLELLERA